MKNITNLLKTIFVLAFFISIPVYAANVYLNPTYPEKRFSTEDKLRAGCINTANIKIESQGESINTINLALKYDSQKIKIIKIIPSDESKDTNYSIEYDKILFNKINNENFKETKTDLFTLYFKSQEDVTESNFEFTQGSYITTKYGRILSMNKLFNIQFTKVPECEPDIIQPQIELIKPINKTNQIALDSSFIFEIKDDGKGIDKKKLDININGQTYKYDDNELFWSGEQLIVYPRARLPINKTIAIEISISDKQKFGGANSKSQKFEVKTATGLVLENYLDPFKFRELAIGYQKLRGTQKECSLVGNMYFQEDGIYEKSAKSILKKLGCSMPQQIENINEEEHTAGPLVIEKVEKKSYVSVFAVIGRGLFLIVLILKLHYRILFTKHKKIVEQYKKLSMD